MKDIFDEILELLPSSTLEILKQHKTDSEVCGYKLEELLNECLAIQNRQTERELQRKCIDVNSKVVENSNILTKLTKDLNASKILMNENNHQNEETLNKKLMEYDIQIAEMKKKLQKVDCDELFNNIEKLNEEILIYRKKLREAECKYECFEDFPPNITEARKAIDDIRERIKKHDKDINSFF